LIRLTITLITTNTLLTVSCNILYVHIQYTDDDDDDDDVVIEPIAIIYNLYLNYYSAMQCSSQVVDEDYYYYD